MKNNHAPDVIAFFGWMFFLLINAYYGGALTMFFSTAPSIPFSTFHEALQAHPTWRWIIEAGYESLPYEKAQGGDPVYVKLWETFKVIC